MKNQPIELSIQSEVGRLRQVMLHRPGAEVDRMVPDLMDELLFDDILYGDRARREHDEFRAVLGHVAEEILDCQDVLAESLKDEGVRLAFLEELAALEGLSFRTQATLADLRPDELARAAIAGLEELQQDSQGCLNRDLPYHLHPLPNTMFMRDPLMVVGDGALLASMARQARRREPLILRYAYGFHPRLQLEARGRFYFDPAGLAGLRYKTGIPGLEGGDVLILSDKVLAIGCSERTSEGAVHLLARHLQRHLPIQTLLLVLLPHRRAVMHLDTVFTQISQEECLVFPPLFLRGSREKAPVLRLDLADERVQVSLREDLLGALEEVGLPMQPICCGGARDRISQEREQWTDGANALALAPGLITLYERNLRTAEELSRHGYEVIAARDVIQERARVEIGRRQVILIGGTELSRARGGPRCLSMPLSRSPL